MPTAFVATDLFSEPDLEALAHGCKCAGAAGRELVMRNRGVAAKIMRIVDKMISESETSLDPRRIDEV